MKHIVLLAVLVVCTTLVLPRVATAQTTPAIPPSITTPDKVETRLGTLDFKDGMPSPATLTKVYDNLDAAHAFNAFVNTLPDAQRRRAGGASDVARSRTHGFSGRHWHRQRQAPLRRMIA